MSNLILQTLDPYMLLPLRSRRCKDMRDNIDGAGSRKQLISGLRCSSFWEMAFLYDNLLVNMRFVSTL
ncbi:hypothetical protein HanRHA438_Chr16g0765701 [Helianthus annuus]|nr:hypothetical protein HanRHA438_Chr16g0765701 [Helianthus annuus]